MAEKDCSRILAKLILEYHLRLARGKRPVAADFREAAGECFEEFEALIEQERLLDEAMGRERFPRAFGNSGEFTLVERLGMGGIGIVYKAIQRNVSRPVALKVLRGGWAGDEQLLQRFLDGARKAAQIEHDHVVHIYDAAVFQGRPYIAMQYVPGVTLGDVFERLRKVGPPPFHAGHHEALTSAGAPPLNGKTNGENSNTFVRRLAHLLIGPAQALQQYHDVGIVHRDVKPGNLILDPQGRLVLTDFDLARKFDTSFSQIAATKVGTPGYMSPEQIDPIARDVDGRADVYSLGVVFYEGMTQRTPFKEPGQASTVYERTLTERAPAPARLTPDLPPDACKVVLKALERQRRDRFPTIAAMTSDLKALAAGRPVRARPVPLAKRVSRRVWGYRWWAAAALVLFAVGAIWWHTRDGTVQIEGFAGGTVYLDGKEEGPAPLRIDLSPGTHEIVVVNDGLEDYRTTVEVEPGGSLRLIAMPPSASLPKQRSAVRFDAAALPLWPRGKVRKQDAKLLRAEMYRPFKGRLLVLDEDDNELDASKFSAKDRHFQQRLSDTVIEKLAVGKTYRWGFELDNGERALAAFTVVPDLPEGTLEDLRSRFKDQQMARLFEIALLQHHGLHAAALEAAERLGKEWPKQIVFGLAWRSLEKLELERSLTAGRTQEHHDDAEE
ncbi:MAG: serine/threonine protein kinase [Planctomycetota bacterium]|jgi:serine/threonine protein kinase